MADRDRTWRDRIPWPHLIANDVHVGNPATMAGRDMASVKQFSFSLNPFALLTTPSMPVLRFDSPAWSNCCATRRRQQLDLQARGKALALEARPRARGIYQGRGAPGKDAVEKADVTADIDTIDADPPTASAGSCAAASTARRSPAAARPAPCSRSSSKHALPDPGRIPLRATHDRLEVEGTMTKPAKLAAIDLRLKLGGAQHGAPVQSPACCCRKRRPTAPRAA
jgi:hypothetical protein